MTTDSSICNHSPLEDGAERRDMDYARLAGGRRWRRRLVAGAAAGGAALLVASTAWACTLRIGTLEVCRGSGTGETDCSQVTASGGQSGGTVTGGTGTSNTLTDVDDNGSTVTVKATSFLPNVPYSITFRRPRNATGNCHRPTQDSSIESLLGTNSTTGLPNTVTANANGNFTSVTSTPNTSADSPATGAAKICVQDTNIATDTPDLSVVTGNVLNVNVALL